MDDTAHVLTTLGESIEQARYLTASQVSPVPLREWLDKTSALSRTQPQPSTPPELFVIWGTLLGNLLRQEKYHLAVHDGVYLADFLNAACCVQGGLMQEKSQFGAIDDPAHYERTPEYVVYNALTFVTGTLAQDWVQPLLAGMLERGQWEPSNLLALLNQTLVAQQGTYLNPPRGHRSPKLKETAFGEVLLALQKTWTICTWRPSQNPNVDRSVYAALWQMYPYDSLCGPTEHEQHAQRLGATIREFPEHGLRAISFLYQNRFVDKRAVEAIFPIRFDLCDPVRAVAGMVMIMEDRGQVTDGKTLVQQAFEEHHPQLNELLLTHFAMHGYVSGTPTNYLVAPWTAICTNMPMGTLYPSVDNLGTLLEE